MKNILQNINSNALNQVRYFSSISFERTMFGRVHNLSQNQSTQFTFPNLCYKFFSEKFSNNCIGEVPVKAVSNAQKIF